MATGRKSNTSAVLYSTGDWTNLHESNRKLIARMRKRTRQSTHLETTFVPFRQSPREHTCHVFRAAASSQQQLSTTAGCQKQARVLGTAFLLARGDSRGLAQPCSALNHEGEGKARGRGGSWQASLIPFHLCRGPAPHCSTHLDAPYLVCAWQLGTVALITVAL